MRQFERKGLELLFWIDYVLFSLETDGAILSNYQAQLNLCNCTTQHNSQLRGYDKITGQYCVSSELYTVKHLLGPAVLRSFGTISHTMSKRQLIQDMETLWQTLIQAQHEDLLEARTERATRTS